MHRHQRIRLLIATALVLDSLLAAPGEAQAPAPTAPSAEAPGERVGSVAAEAPGDEASTPSAEDLAAAAAVIDDLHGAILKIMRGARQLGFSGRYDLMFEAVDRTFDLPFMARASIGRFWRDLDEAGRRRWVELSRRLSATNYAHNFDGFEGEKFAVVSREPADRDTVRVETLLINTRDLDVRFDYRLRRTPQGWRIIDIQLDGTVSELALRRADYASTIKRSGFEQLVRDLEQKIAEMSSSP